MVSIDGLTKKDAVKAFPAPGTGMFTEGCWPQTAREAARQMICGLKAMTSSGQAKLARTLKIRIGTVNEWLRGNGPVPTRDQLDKLDFLLGFKGACVAHYFPKKKRKPAFKLRVLSLSEAAARKVPVSIKKLYERNAA